MPEKYDVIIIGAGIGGLTAAAFLSRNGKKVLVLEKNTAAGGYAVNFKRDGFEFDVAVHLINSFAKGGIAYSILEKCGVADKLVFLKPRHVFRSMFPDIDISIPQNDLKRLINILTEYFPNEKEGIEKLFNLTAKIFCRLEDAKGDKISPTDFVDLVNKTYGEITDEFLHDERLKAFVSQLWIYYGLPPSKLSALYYSYPSHDYICNGAYYPKGGGQAISNALVGSIRQNDGKIIFNSEVEKILIKENAAYGVRMKNGQEFFSEYLISDIDARTTFKNLVGQEYLDKSFIDKIDLMEPSMSAFAVYLGLNVDLRKLGFDDYTILVHTDYDMEKQYNSCLNNDFANVPFIVTLYSNIEKDYAPDGKFAMTISTFSNYDFWKSILKAKYKEEKNNIAHILIEKAEKIIPNLSSYVEVLETATPLTMERYTGSYRGAIYGWGQMVFQSGSKRLKNKTPINNLYLVGAWTYPGGGIKGVMQFSATVSNAILKKNI